MGIDNTARRMQEEPSEGLLFLADALIARDGGGSFITNQERAGQRQLVNSDRLPVRLNSGEQAEYEALGFTFGEPDPDDPLFRPATLPPGWTRQGSDHAMWSHLLDEHGRRRVAIFYKAAFYDRSAFMNLETLWSYASAVAEGDCPLVLDEWATRDGVLEALREHAADWRQYAASAAARGDAKGAAVDEGYAAKYEAAIAALEAKQDSRG